MSRWQHRLWVFMTFRGRPTLEALMIALCNGDEFLLSRVRLQRVILKTEKYISELPFFYFMVFKFILYVIEYGVFPFSFRIHRFTRLPVHKQVQVLATWDANPNPLKRNLFKFVKGTCLSHILAETKLLEALGYGEMILDRVGKKATLVPPLSKDLYTPRKPT